MQITTFNPFISTSHSDETVMLFEQLGFMRRHKKEGIEIADRDDTVIRMKDASGFYLDVLEPEGDLPCDLVGIRMNGEETVHTSSSKAAMMVSPSGFRICIIQHVKE